MTTAPWWNPEGGGLPSRPDRPPRVPIPGLADWSTRASASAIEISITTGLMAAYSSLLYLAKPVFALVQAIALLVSVDIKPLFAFLYWGVGAGFLIWQWSIRGITGQSLGQKLMGIVTVDEDSGRPIGPARSILRSVLHVVDIAPAFFGYARPVFHFRNQTWADTISHSVVVKMSTIVAIAEER